MNVKCALWCTWALLDVQEATGEDSAVTVAAVLEKAVALKSEHLAEGEEMPYDLLSEEEFLLSARRIGRIQIGEGTVHLAPRAPRAPRTRNQEDGAPKPRRSAKTAEGEAKTAEGEASPRRRRPQGTPQDPKDITLADDVNDSTLIAHLVYKCAPGNPCFVALLVAEVVLQFSLVCGSEKTCHAAAVALQEAVRARSHQHHGRPDHQDASAPRQHGLQGAAARLGAHQHVQPARVQNSAGTDPRPQAPAPTCCPQAKQPWPSHSP